MIFFCIEPYRIVVHVPVQAAASSFPHRHSAAASKDGRVQCRIRAASRNGRVQCCNALAACTEGRVQCCHALAASRDGRVQCRIRAACGLPQSQLGPRQFPHAGKQASEIK